MSKRKRKWRLRKPSGNIPPSRRWVRHKYGRGEPLIASELMVLPREERAPILEKAAEEYIKETTQ